MHEEIVIGGFGGQGVLFLGRLLTEAAFHEEHEVVFMPSYGAEKRGGAVWCHVTISDEKIGALFIDNPTVAVAMSPASLVKLEPVMKRNGLLVVNQSLVTAKLNRDDIDVIYVPASDMAAELGDSSAGNLVTLGALLANRPVVSVASVMTVMGSMYPQSEERLAVNQRAFERGYNLARRDHTRRASGVKEK